MSEAGQRSEWASLPARRSRTSLCSAARTHPVTDEVMPSAAAFEMTSDVVAERLVTAPIPVGAHGLEHVAVVHLTAVDVQRHGALVRERVADQVVLVGRDEAAGGAG